MGLLLTGTTRNEDTIEQTPSLQHGFTCQEAKAAFQHVLDNVLSKDDSSPLKMAIVAEGIEDVFTMMTMDDTIIDTLVYDKSPTETNVAVNRGEKSLAKGIQAYVRYLIANGNPLSEAAEWMALTQQDFDLFHVTMMTPVGMTTVGPVLNVVRMDET